MKKVTLKVTHEVFLFPFVTFSLEEDASSSNKFQRFNLGRRRPCRRKDLTPEHVDLYVSSGVGRVFIHLQRSGFQCSESAPLLLLCPDPANYEASLAYMHGGNYALPTGSPGQRAWPGGAAPADGTALAHLPAGVDVAPPFALGRFILEQFPAAVDKTKGTSLNVIFLPDLEVYGDICLAIMNSEQFHREAASYHTHIEPPLVHAFLLDRIDGRPRAQRHFTLTAAPGCWQTDVLASVTRAVREIQRLGKHDARHRVRTKPAAEKDLLAFDAWFQRNVGQQELPVAVRHVGNQGLGLVARRDIAQDAAFLSIPYAMILGTHLSLGPQAHADKWKSVQNDPLLRQFPSCNLALRLLAEACKPATASSAFFGPYIAILPETFEIPLFYEAEDFAFLANTPLFTPAVRQLYNAIKQFCYLHVLLSRWKGCPIPSEKFTIGNYFWALGAVLTRQNEVAVVESSSSEPSSAMALIPGWDLCNHEQSDVISTFSDPRDAVVTCQAIRAFQQDEQVTMFYGRRTNQQFLLYSGFVLEANANDRGQLQLQLSTKDPLFKIRRMLIAKEAAGVELMQLEDGDLRVGYTADATGSIVSKAMVRALQTAAMDKEHLTSALRNGSVVGTEEVYEWSEDEKQRALQTHRSCCEQTRADLEEIEHRKAASKHATLLLRYFKSQQRILNAAMSSSDPFNA
ncbi:hypothetical protein BBJ28_00008230 [Nothophytophthora sp. Chile5]|nr:hypothetical protein BBJ28_00008230 [Nothophytophthora sp. Chile5]